MSIADQRSFIFRKTLGGVFLVMLFFGFMFISGWKWNLISASATSLLFTPIIILFGSGESARYLRVDLWEYWIAAFVWILTFGLSLRYFLKLLFKPTRSSTSQNRNLDSHPYVRWRGASKVVLVAFVFVSLTAPFLAPFRPSSQGDLTSTRLLKPLEKGIIAVEPELMTETEASTGSPSWIVRTVDNANRFLLDRRERFAHFTGSYTMGGQILATQVRTFFLGTDDLGRDVLSRVIYGTRISLGIGFCAMLCTVVIGCLIGFLAGVYGSWADRILMRLTDLFLAVPSLFFVIALIAFFGSSTVLLIAVLAVTGWMSVARLVRGEVLMLREREFILSARLLGRSSVQILRDHMLPNVTPTILAASVLQLGNVILAEAALSFLGLGVQPPTPSWGNMIGESMAFIDSAWWVGVFPGIALSILMVTVNVIAESVEKASRLQQ
jgi:peptide/nickel transport system permease protein